MNFTDQQLSAYLDGELPEDESRALEAALQDDAALREALVRLRNVDAVLSETLGDIADEPVPAHITDLIAGNTPSEVAGTVIPFAAWKDRLSGFAMPASLAASLLVGVFFGAQFLGMSGQGEASGLLAGVVDSRSDLHAVLERTTSGEARSGISPILSFMSEDGVCREVSTATQRALACREAAVWTVVVVAQEETVSASGGYRTASSNTSIIFDVLADQLMTGAPMSADAEARLIRNAWQEPVTTTED